MEAHRPTGNDPTALESSQSTDIDRASTPRCDATSLAASLRTIAAGLISESMAVFPPSRQEIAGRSEMLERAAEELERLRDLRWRDLRTERGIEDEARLILHRLDELEGSTDHIRKLAIVDALARAELRGYERGRADQAPFEQEHRGCDWAAIRQAERAQRS